MKSVVTFGEIMLRLAPPGFERFLQSPQFVATFGGGEANVAVSVAGFGWPARYTTVLPDKNPISEAFLGEMRRFGVDVSAVVRGAGRFGIYFVENGANQRGSKAHRRSVIEHWAIGHSLVIAALNIGHYFVFSQRMRICGSS